MICMGKESKKEKRVEIYIYINIHITDSLFYIPENNNMVNLLQPNKNF